MENKGHPLKSSFSFGSHFIVDYRLLIGARGEVSRMMMPVLCAPRSLRTPITFC